MMANEAKRAAWFLGRTALGQAGAIVRTSFALPALGAAGIMLALALQPLVPILSRLQARLTASHEVSADVIGQRFVCDDAAARQLALRGMERIGRGESGCKLRAEALLRFADHEGKAHEVVALDPSGSNDLRVFTATYRPDAFRRAIPLADPQVMAEAGAIDRLDKLVGGAPALVAGMQEADWTQWQALQLRAGDPLLFDALDWLGPPRGTKVALRYANGAPERAWIVALLDTPDEERVPLGAVFVLGAVGIYLIMLACQVYFITWRRWSAEIAAALILLSSPWWALRIFETMEFFSARVEIVSGLREDFDLLETRHDRRTEPMRNLALKPVTAPAELDGLQRTALGGLIPPRPEREFANLGDSLAALCAAAGERLSALPKTAREEHLGAASELLKRGVDGPTWCLVPAAIRELDAARDPGDARAAYNLVTLAAYAQYNAGDLAGSYAQSLQLREQALAALTRALERGRQ